jgi:hypothetical protein
MSVDGISRSFYGRAVDTGVFSITTWPLGHLRVSPSAVEVRIHPRFLNRLFGFREHALDPESSRQEVAFRNRGVFGEFWIQADDGERLSSSILHYQPERPLNALRSGGWNLYNCTGADRAGLYVYCQPEKGCCRRNSR